MFALPWWLGALTLINNGLSDYVIVLPSEDGHRRVERAGEALQKYLLEATGVNLPLVKEFEAAGRPGIYLGKTSHGESAGVPYDKLHDYTYCIKVVGKDVFLAGFDAPGNIKGGLLHHDKEYLGQSHGLNLHVKNREYKEWHGTHRAVMAFLERYAGVHFLLPGVNGRHIVKTGSVSLDDRTDIVFTPSFQYCFGRCFGDLDTTLALNHTDPPFYKNYGGHTFNVAVPVGIYGKTHPEYYILKDGKRQPWYGPAGGNHLCISNPEVQELMLEEFGRQYDAGYRWVQIAPTDGQVECECGECSSMGDKTERQWKLFRSLAERIKVRWPDAKVVFLAYGFTKTPPKSFDTFPDNVVIELTIWSNFSEKFEEWKKFEAVPKLAYIYFFGSYTALIYSPIRTPRYVAENLRIMKENNILGIFKCGWATGIGLEGPVCYVFSKMLEDTTREPEALMDEYCNFAYGKAAANMRTFFKLLYANLDTARGKSTLDELEARPRNPETLHSFAYRPGMLNAADIQLNAAFRANDPDPKVRARLNLVKREFDFLVNRAHLYILSDAWAATHDRELIPAIERKLNQRDKILDMWCDANGNARMEPGFDWPIFQNANRHLLLYGGGSVIGPYPTEFRYGIGPLKKAMNMKTKPEDMFFRAATKQTFPWTQFTYSFTRQWQYMPAPDFPTTFNLSITGDKVVIAAQCNFSSAKWNEFAAMKDATLEQEAFRVWIDTEGMQKRFVTFAVNPFGQRFQARQGFIADPLHPEANKLDTTWEAPWTCDTQIDANGKRWMAVIAIPLSTLECTGPAPGSSWRINFARATNAWSLAPGNDDPGTPAAYGRVDF